MKTEFNYDGILENVCKTLKNSLGLKIFVGSRPAAVESTMNVFAVVELGNGITDNGDTYQSSTLLVSLFVRDKQGNLENTKKLGELIRKCTGLFPMKDELFTALSPRLLYKGSDTMGFHAASIQGTLIINK